MSSSGQGIAQTATFVTLGVAVIQVIIGFLTWRVAHASDSAQRATKDVLDKMKEILNETRDFQAGLLELQATGADAKAWASKQKLAEMFDRLHVFEMEGQGIINTGFASTVLDQFEEDLPGLMADLYANDEGELAKRVFKTFNASYLLINSNLTRDAVAVPNFVEIKTGLPLKPIINELRWGQQDGQDTEHPTHSG